MDEEGNSDKRETRRHEPRTLSLTKTSSKKIDRKSSIHINKYIESSQADLSAVLQLARMRIKCSVTRKPYHAESKQPSKTAMNSRKGGKYSMPYRENMTTSTLNFSTQYFAIN